MMKHYGLNDQACADQTPPMIPPVASLEKARLVLLAQRGERTLAFGLREAHHIEQY